MSPTVLSAELFLNSSVCSGQKWHHHGQVNGHFGIWTSPHNNRSLLWVPGGQPQWFRPRLRVVLNVRHLDIFQDLLHNTFLVSHRSPGKAPARYASRGPVSMCSLYQLFAIFIEKPCISGGWLLLVRTTCGGSIPDSHKTMPKGFRRWKSFCWWERDAGSSNVLACSTVQPESTRNSLPIKTLRNWTSGACRLMGDWGMVYNAPQNCRGKIHGLIQPNYKRLVLYIFSLFGPHMGWYDCSSSLVLNKIKPPSWVAMSLLTSLRSVTSLLLSVPSVSSALMSLLSLISSQWQLSIDISAQCQLCLGISSQCQLSHVSLSRHLFSRQALSWQLCSLPALV